MINAPFSMYKNWIPDNTFPDYLIRLGMAEKNVNPSVLQEFKEFWINKPNVRKTHSQWQSALAQSCQYAFNREKHYKQEQNNANTN